MPHTPEMIAAAERVGLRDMDLLKLVDPALPPAAALDKLRQRLPGAFRPDVRTLNRQDYAAARDEMLRGNRR